MNEIKVTKCQFVKNFWRKNMQFLILLYKFEQGGQQSGKWQVAVVEHKSLGLSQPMRLHNYPWNNIAGVTSNHFHIGYKMLGIKWIVFIVGKNQTM